MKTKTEALFSIDIRAPREKVWAAITQMGEVQPFYFETVLEGVLEPGGWFHYRSADAKRAFVRGKFLEVVAPERLVMQFSFTDLEPETTVLTWELAEIPGGTRVNAKHVGEAPRSFKRIAGGHVRIQEGLKRWLEEGRIPLRQRVGNSVFRLLSPILPASTKLQNSTPPT